MPYNASPNHFPDGGAPVRHAESGIFLTGRECHQQVHFSKGNLQATCKSSTSSYTWSFATNQYDYIGNAAGNTTIDSQTNGAVVDLFGWSTSTTTYGIKTSTSSSDYSGDFVDWGKAIGDGNTWRTLSKDEWTYLFNTRTVNGSNRNFGCSVRLITESK